MAGIQASSPAAPSEVTISAKAGLTISSLSIPTAGTEIALVIPANVVDFSMKAASNQIITIATTALATGTDNKWTLNPGVVWMEPLLTNNLSVTLYITSNKNNTVIEYKTWV